MLKLSTGRNLSLDRTLKSQKLSKLRKELENYFGFVSANEIAEALAFRQTVTEQQQNLRDDQTAAGDVSSAASVRTAISNVSVASSTGLVPIFEILLDDGDGTRKMLDTGSATENTETIKDKLQQYMNSGQNQSQQTLDKIRDVARCINLHYCANSVATTSGNGFEGNNSNGTRVFFDDLDQTLPFNRTGENLSPTEINEIKKRVVAVCMQNPLLTPGEKNSELLTVFFNAMPALELTRATPVLNVTIYSSRPVVENGRLASITLQKFLEGSVEEPQGQENAALRAINLASQVATSSIPNQTPTLGSFENYTVTGLELFRAPQTLQNIDETKKSANQPDKYLAPIIDPMRPLASIKGFSIDMKSAFGLQGTRTGTLEIVLHDRSRLGEFVDFVKPDRYGTSFIEVEYGWSHPDSWNDDRTKSNPYADLLNLTRVRDHLNIVTSTLSFDEVGQVNITLNLMGRGSSESNELSIVGPSSAAKIQTTIRRIEELSTTINNFARSLEPAEQNSGTRREIRGIQALNAASDAINNLVINEELLKHLRDLNAALGARANSGDATTSQAATQLRNSIQELIGEVQGKKDSPTLSNNNNNPSAIRQVQRSVNDEIRGILGGINSVGAANFNNKYNDIFLRKITSEVWGFLRENNRNIENRDDAITPENPPGSQILATGNDGAGAGQRNTGNNVDPWLSRKVVSLGSLIMAFVAKPLAELKDSTARNQNIPKFKEVQVLFYNFNNKASIMSNCNISQFPVQTRYFVREYSRLRLENVSRAVNLSITEFMNFLSTKIVDDVMNPAYGINDLYKTNQSEVTVRNERSFDVDMLQRMIKYNVGRHSDFVPPQLTFEMESIPIISPNSGENGTILKIHVYDKVCSAKTPLRELLSLSVNNFMNGFSNYPPNRQQAEAIISRAGDIIAQSRGNQKQEFQNLKENWRELHNVMVEQATRNRLIQPITPIGEDGIQKYRFVGGPQRLKQYIMKNIPNIIYGAMGSTVRSSNLSSISNPMLNSINMQRSLNTNPVLPNGSQPGGVPLSIYGMQLSMTTIGCPLLRHIGQEVFVDFNTNTTADNIYYITGFQHKIESGTFETSITFTATDAFGQYRNMINQMNTAGDTLRAILNQTTPNPSPTSPTSQPNSSNSQRRRQR